MKKMKELVLELNRFSKPTVWDWIMLYAIIVLCSFFMCQNFDLFCISNLSSEWVSLTMHGKFFQFYDITMERAISGAYFGDSSILNGPNYNILVYITWGIILIPLKIFGKLFGYTIDVSVMVIYGKLILIMLGMILGYVMYRIGMKITNENKVVSKYLAFMTLSSSIMIMGSNTFGQIDVIPLIFLMIALYYYLDDKLLPFLLIASLGICYKGIIVLAIIPLVLLKEKRLLYIIRNAIGLCIFPALTKLMFIGSTGYATCMKEINNAYNFKTRLWGASITNEHFGISYFIVIYIVLCFAAYYIKTPEKNRISRYVAFIPLVAFTSFYTFVFWHPQWVVILAPFIALNLVLMQKKRLGLLLDLGILIGYVMSTIVNFPNNVDNYMINNGFIARITGEIYSGKTIADIYNATGLSIYIVYSLFAGCLLCFVILSYMELIHKKENTQITTEESDRLIVWLRPIVMLVFLIVSLVLYVQ